jgi:hypothetical protein
LEAGAPRHSRASYRDPDIAPPGGQTVDEQNIVIRSDGDGTEYTDENKNEVDSTTTDADLEGLMDDGFITVQKKIQSTHAAGDSASSKAVRNRAQRKGVSRRFILSKQSR